MRILLVDAEGLGLSFASRCASAGHSVRWYEKVKPAEPDDTGIGFGVEKIKNWLSSVRWADLIFATGNCDFVARLETFGKRGFPYYGPSVASADLEIKRGVGMAFLQKHGIEVPPHQTFKTLGEAERFVWKNERRWVFKTLGDCEDKSLSYCSKSPADMIARLRRWQEMKMNPKGPVILQEFIDGIEIGVSRWMGKAGWVSPPNVNFEYKKLSSGNYGPNTGEMGSVLVYEMGEKLATDVLNPLEKGLVELGHLGDIDVNCIVDKNGKAWPLEFTARTGWPAFNVMLEAHKGDPAEWMRDAIHGKPNLDVSFDVAVGLVIAIPRFPYPNEDPKYSHGHPLYGMHRGNAKHLYPQQVKIEKMPDMDGEKVVERNLWVSTGEYVAVACALGSTVSVAAKRAYKTVEEVSIADMMVRDDIGEGLRDSLPELHKHGYATSVNY